MTIILTIPIPDDLKAAFERTHPGVPIEQAVRHWLREESAAVKSPTSPEDVASFMARMRKIRDASIPTSDDEIWRLRQEGRL